MFLLDPPPDFCGLDPNEDITIYKRHLPHWRQKRATYFVTFRLADSLPQSKLTELRQLREEWKRKHFAGREPKMDDVAINKHKNEWEELSRELMDRTEKWLDNGMGSCVLRQSRVRQIVEDALTNFDGERYELGGFVIMPNHVHAIIRPFDEFSLEKVLQSRKLWTSRQINEALGQTGTLWQQESYDRIIRDTEHLWKALQYIGRNPRLAGIDTMQSTRWVRPEWAKLGWEFVDET